ncbi:hypothetical protein [Labrys monachus]|uniref:Uncharacterized protein n=1 Tax=Labrys monachus TaxID=217067 RepID=A0ABU0FFM7_9HYPH|nr:hypothetical protein [Labrys monachus]MDQ0393409.1 hypothetical protein [Labrys monachus]
MNSSEAGNASSACCGWSVVSADIGSADPFLPEDAIHVMKEFGGAWLADFALAPPRARRPTGLRRARAWIPMAERRDAAPVAASRRDLEILHRQGAAHALRA